MDNRKAIHFAVAYAVRKQLDSLVQDLKDECKPLEEYLLENLGKAGISGFKIAQTPENSSLVRTHIARINRVIEGNLNDTNIVGHTVYILRELWAGAIDGWDKVNEALENVGMADIITHKPNTQTLSSHVRKDYPRTEDTDMPILPPEMAEAVKITEKFSVRMRSKSA